MRDRSEEAGPLKGPCGEIIDLQLLPNCLAGRHGINLNGETAKPVARTIEMSHRGSVVLTWSIELFTIITAAYLGYFLMLGFGFLGRESFLGWLGAFMLIMSTFATALFLSVLVTPD